MMGHSVIETSVAVLNQKFSESHFADKYYQFPTILYYQVRSFFQVVCFSDVSELYYPPQERVFFLHDCTYTHTYKLICIIIKKNIS